MLKNEFNEKVIKQSLPEEVSDFKFLKSGNEYECMAKIKYNDVIIYIENKYYDSSWGLEEILHLINCSIEEYNNVNEKKNLRGRVKYIERILRIKYTNYIEELEIEDFLEYKQKIYLDIEKAINSTIKEEYPQIYKYYVDMFDMDSYLDKIKTGARQ